VLFSGQREQNYSTALGNWVPIRTPQLSNGLFQFTDSTPVTTILLAAQSQVPSCCAPGVIESG
jgi:hypothetical protein